MNDKQIILSLTRELEEATKSKWISVTDRLPNERCLAYTPEQDEVGTWRIIPKGLFRQAASEATHWQPLTTPEIK